jgi:hypothetical protein
MASDPPKVLISYSHDSPEHQKRVLTLAQSPSRRRHRLRNRSLCCRTGGGMDALDGKADRGFGLRVDGLHRDLFPTGKR